MCRERGQTQTNSEWANYVGSMLLSSRDTDADACAVIVSRRESSPIAQSVTKLLQQIVTVVPEWDQDPLPCHTNRLHVLVLAGVQYASTRLSHRSETVTPWLQGTPVRHQGH